MLNLTKAQVEKWYNTLPEDIKSSIKEDVSEDNDQTKDFCNKIEEAAPHEWSKIIKDHKDLIFQIGRMRRLRLMAHISAKVYPYNVKVFHQIVSDDEDESGSGEKSIKQLLLEDIKLLNQALSKRIVNKSLDDVALNALKASSFEVEPKMGI